MKSTIGDRDVLEKRVAKNHRYDNTKATLDTGTHVLNTKAPEKADPRRAHEKFMRISSNKLWGILSEGNEGVLVIDVREVEEYDKGKMVGALHYPPAMLCRAMNPFLPEMFAFKNKEGRRVVAYDLDDGVVVSKVAGLLFEKGFDNIYVLTGGLQDYVRDHAAGIEGVAPRAGPAADSRPVRVTRDSDSVSGSAHGGRSVAQSRMSTMSNARYV